MQGIRSRPCIAIQSLYTAVLDSVLHLLCTKIIDSKMKFSNTHAKQKQYILTKCLILTNNLLHILFQEFVSAQLFQVTTDQIYIATYLNMHTMCLPFDISKGPNLPTQAGYLCITSRLHWCIHEGQSYFPCTRVQINILEEDVDSSTGRLLQIYSSNSYRNNHCYSQKNKDNQYGGKQQLLYNACKTVHKDMHAYTQKTNLLILTESLLFETCWNIYCILLLQHKILSLAAKYSVTLVQCIYVESLSSVCYV